MSGARAVAAAMQGTGIAAHIVFLPMLPSDDQAAAEQLAASLAAPGLQCWWDAERSLGRELAQVLPIAPAEIAWDVFLAYPAGRTLAMPPAGWCHQMSAIAPEHSARGRLPEALRELAARARDGR